MSSGQPIILIGFLVLLLAGLIVYPGPFLIVVGLIFIVAGGYILSHPDMFGYVVASISIIGGFGLIGLAAAIRNQARIIVLLQNLPAQSPPAPPATLAEPHSGSTSNPSDGTSRRRGDRF
ncbi:hypothetical protein SAMN02745172_02487 [Pseudoxanthobacter soli DSM 19599]|uniref:Uncharacterized protein n=1 Tax=Pseudoxanthobacter soli DSM 19599 TaxID=1123029 RepID=A0A1M7ZLR4_9HYPH|nr:hypothetical protein [Pseudoxanthobacter soli]SHO65840.1 hypothetical protein SAMN02745172_02487 [Pseudoxanthobacter soli DSM 19599]